MNPFTSMERVSSLIARMRLGAPIDPQELAVHAWAGAVGKRIAAHTRAARLFGATLVIEVEDEVWQRQLTSLAPHILFNIGKSIGEGRVQRLSFQVKPQRLGPRRAERPADEADGIEDPTLRGIYRASRSRASA